MSYKKNNPARTNLVLLTVVLSLFILLDVIFLLTVISILVAKDSQSVDAAFNVLIGVQALCFFIPLAIIYTVVAFSISLWGRGVYGRRHEIYTLIGFFFAMGGLAMTIFLPMVTLMIGDTDTSVTLLLITLPMPMLMMVTGLYLFIKDIGGMVMGAIGLGIHTFGRMVWIFFALLLYHGGEEFLDAALVGWIFSFLISLAGMIVLMIGFVNAFQWTSVHEPLIDEQEAQQLQMQQQQLNLQNETLQLQREQLLLQQETVRMIQNQSEALIESGVIGNIPDRSSARNDFDEEWYEDDEDW
ncbi:MAG: hypothetical protein ACMUIE_04070 [Thermoplasmatota archaeon]